jgi:cellulose biosynthesis protein BcsQ
MIGKIISIVNRKGGVGKTTLAIALADAFISEHRRHVSLFDLDPQSTASQALIEEQNFINRCEASENLYGLISAYIENENIDIANYKQGMAHRISNRGDVDLRLFPNSDLFWDLEQKEIQRDGGVRLSQSISECLQREAENKSIVLVDCPPGQSVSALAAINTSHMVLCPITPDRFALWGTKLLQKYINSYSNGVSPIFIVTRANFNTSAAREFFQNIQTYQNIDILRVDTGPLTPATAGDIAYVSEKQSVRRRINLAQDRTLAQIYGNDIAQQLKKVANAIMGVLENNG